MRQNVTVFGSLIVTVILFLTGNFAGAQPSSSTPVSIKNVLTPFRLRCQILLNKVAPGLKSPVKLAITTLDAELIAIVNAPKVDDHIGDRVIKAIEIELSKLDNKSKIELLRSVNSEGDWGVLPLFSYDHSTQVKLGINWDPFLRQIRTWAVERLIEMKTVDSLIALSDVLELYGEQALHDKVEDALKNPDIPSEIRRMATLGILMISAKHFDYYKPRLVGHKFSSRKRFSPEGVPLLSDFAIAEDKFRTIHRNQRWLDDLYLKDLDPGLVLYKQSLRSP